MKKIYSLLILIIAFSLSVPTPSLAQGMMGGSYTTAQSDDGHTAREEAEGKEILGKLQSGELDCGELTDENFGSLGEYFMGQMAGDSHEAMNNMMTAMLGEEGESAMHVALGKRMSGCEPNAALPQNMMNVGMMQMMGGGLTGDWSNALSIINPLSMMNFGYAPFGWIFMILFWGLIIAGIVALIKWIAGQNTTDSKTGKSALDILKERYAKGEINKKEFEEKKKDLK